MISRKHKFIFIHVPKTGGNSVSRSLLPYTESYLEEASSPAGFGSGENFWTVDPELGRDKHFTAEMYAERMDIRDYFIFSTVRNPWDWAVSLYFFRKQTGGDSANLWTTVGPNEFDKFEFINFLESGEPPQSSFLGNGQFPIRLLRFETLTADFQSICAHLKIGNLQLEKINSSRRPDYNDILDTELKAKIVEIYGRDFERFGYKF